MPIRAAVLKRTTKAGITRQWFSAIVQEPGQTEWEGAHYPTLGQALAFKAALGLREFSKPRKEKS